jgi:hypothetical protein
VGVHAYVWTITLAVFAFAWFSVQPVSDYSVASGVEPGLCFTQAFSPDTRALLVMLGPMYLHAAACVATCVYVLRYNYKLRQWRTQTDRRVLNFTLSFISVFLLTWAPRKRLAWLCGKAGHWLQRLPARCSPFLTLPPPSLFLPLSFSLPVILLLPSEHLFYRRPRRHLEAEALLLLAVAFPGTGERSRLDNASAWLVEVL